MLVGQKPTKSYSVDFFSVITLFNLSHHVSGSNSKRATLNWARRLKIAVDAAKGSESLTPSVVELYILKGTILLVCLT